MNDFGDFDECLAVQIPYSTRQTIKGTKYCLARLNMPFNLKQGPLLPNLQREFQQKYNRAILGSINPANVPYFIWKGWHFGICFPSTCSSQEMQSILNDLININGANITVLDDDLCVAQDEHIDWSWHLFAG